MKRNYCLKHTPNSFPKGEKMKYVNKLAAFLVIMICFCGYAVAQNPVVSLIAYQGDCTKPMGNSGTIVSPNTIAAMQNAVEGDVYATHCDLRLTQDDRILVYAHEDLFGLMIADTPYPLLAEHPAFHLNGGETIPDFKEYLLAAKKALEEQQARKGAKTRLFLQLHAMPLEEQNVRFVDMFSDLMGEVIEASTLRDRIMVASDNLEMCQMLEERVPYAEVFYVGSNHSIEKIVKAGLEGVLLHVKDCYHQPDLVKAFQKAGMTVAVLPVGTENALDIFKLMDMGVDVFATTTPAEFRSLLQKREKGKRK